MNPTPKKTKDKEPERTLAAQNRKARFDFEILDKIEAGIVLRGSEVKSLRAGKASIEEAYAAIDLKGEVFLIGAHIDEYRQASVFGHQPRQKRKLLLHKEEILRLQQKLKEKGLTIVPLSLYFDRNGRAKCEIALARGKRQFDKRQSIKQSEAKREISRAIRRARG